jgi:hypothetical protein
MNEIIVNGKVVSPAEFDRLRDRTDIKLVQVAPSIYITMSETEVYNFKMKDMVLASDKPPDIPPAVSLPEEKPVVKSNKKSRIVMIDDTASSKDETK